MEKHQTKPSQFELKKKEIYTDLRQALAILEDCKPGWDAYSELRRIGDFAQQAAKGAYVLAGSSETRVTMAELTAVQLTIAQTKYARADFARRQLQTEGARYDWPPDLALPTMQQDCYTEEAFKSVHCRMSTDGRAFTLAIDGPLLVVERDGIRKAVTTIHGLDEASFLAWVGKLPYVISKGELYPVYVTESVTFVGLPAPHALKELIKLPAEFKENK